jgi:type IV pilus assembly protein PilC
MGDRRAESVRQAASGSVKSAKAAPRRLHGIGRMIKLDLCPFTRRLAAMLDAGLPLVQCMDALSEQTATPEFRLVVKDLGARIEGGDSFSEALNRYKDLFGELYVSMIRAGEIGGGLAEVTDRLALYLETSMAMKRKVKSAMTYPTVVMSFAFLITTGLILFIVPVFKGIFADFGGTLPLPTLILVKTSDIMRQFALYVVGAVAVAIWLLRRYFKTQQGAMAFDRFVLKAPVAGKIIEKVAVARMARTFASMLRSGVPILRCMEIVSKATGNRYIGAALVEAGTKIEGGAPLARAIQESGRFPPMVIHMLAAGEKTGNVDGMLEKVADFYEDEVTNALASLSSMIEPLLMVFLGVVVGGIVVAMFMPIFKLGSLVQG